MSRLNNDCLEILFENFADEPDGSCLLYNCTLLNREWRNIATRYLYKDPWKYWLYQCKDTDIAKQLIDTYMSCYNATIISRRQENGANWNSDGGERGDEERRSTRRRIGDYVDDEAYDNHQLPLYDYISYAKNLHIPALYQCIKIWYENMKGIDQENQEEEPNIEPIYRLFLGIFELFVERAHIQDCTFAESTEVDRYPITLDQLGRLINHGCQVNLKYLNLGFFQCDSNGLSKITGNCDNLRTFKVSAQKCSDEALANFIKSQKRLTKLKIRNAEKIDLTLEALGTQSSSLVKLRILSCNLESCITPFNSIAACSKLRSIYMRKINYWPIGISPSTLLMPIARNCEFHNVDFSCTNLPVDVLVEIAKKSSTTLRRVHLVRPETQVNYSDLHEEFNLSAGIKALGDHAKNISHFERDISPNEVNAMIYFVHAVGNSLIRLEIESRLMNSYDADASNLISSIGDHCSKLEILNINFFNFTPQAFDKLIQGCKSLTSLSICNSMAVDDNTLNILRDKCGENFKYLEIYACNRVSEVAVEQLRAEKTEIEVIWP